MFRKKNTRTVSAVKGITVSVDGLSNEYVFYIFINQKMQNREKAMIANFNFLRAVFL